jgi:ADP-ribosyl-[dinitrogen reductase] hydrolase
MDRRTPDHFSGCLLGGAIGDALGAAVEFLSLGDIRHRFGPAGLTDYAPAYGRLGALTDDTQMTLFTAEGLIQADDRGRERGTWDPPSMVHAAYLRWLATQGDTSAHPLFDPHPQVGLAALSELNSQRAPGNTCLSALRGRDFGTMDQPLNSSKGAGGIMRIAPVGLAFEQPFEMACRIAALTHGHPSGYLAAGAFAVVIARLVAGNDLHEAATAAAEELARWPRHQQTLQALEAGLDLAEKPPATPERVEQLGEGWVAEEALAIGVYCALVADGFSHGVLLAVNHGGDSDTTGTLTGQLLGTMVGRQALPARWLSGLELRDEIGHLTQDLYDRYHLPPT